jgi:peptidoglycan/xylan/chitin deacetylase (PgdA/CDA1 family)
LPFYHAVSNDIPKHLKHLFHVKTVTEFRNDLDYILRYYKPIELEDLISRKSAKNFVHFSFDDGLREVYEIIMPVLLEKSIPASLFINPAFVDNNALFYKHKISLILDQFNKVDSNLQREILNLFPDNQHIEPKSQIVNIQYSDTKLLDSIAAKLNISFSDYLASENPYMTTIQLKEWRKNGFSLGAHSWDHPMYNRIPESEQLNQTEKSISFVKNLFSEHQCCFAFPYTDFGVKKSFFDSLHSINHPPPLTFGTAGIKHDSVKTNLQRIPMEEKKSAKQILRGEYSYFFAKALLGKNTIHR